MKSLLLLFACSSMWGQAFSSQVTPYADQPAVSVASAISQTSTKGVKLTNAETAVRQEVMQMYLGLGFNPALDYKNDESTVLLNYSPKSFASSTGLDFSPDSPFYQAIPAGSQKVLLPSGYIHDVQLNSVDTNRSNGDGIGFGITTATASDSQLTVTSEWYTDKSTLVTFPFRMSTKWTTAIPQNPSGDKHVIFIDPVSRMFVSSYMTSANKKTGGPQGLYVGPPTSFNSLGDRGGSTASKMADLPLMIKPGELESSKPLTHAIGGPVARTWAARVFPAYARDAGILTSVNTCTGKGYMNTGLVPYGGVIQLDPKLDLTTLKLSLPALRILQAMQTYGYYVMDFGCTDLDVYTSISETELEPYGGAYGNKYGVGVQNEIQKIIASSNLYVVPPMVKK